MVCSKLITMKFYVKVSIVHFSAVIANTASKSACVQLFPLARKLCGENYVS